jgi:hypothetical protein
MAAAPATTHDLVFKAVKLAGLKATAAMMSNGSNMSKNCLCAAAVAARILKHFDVKFEPVVGYTQVPGTSQSFPHVWLESPGGYVTDLTFSGPMREVVILNWAVGFHDDAVRAKNTREPLYAVDWSKCMPRVMDVLTQQASNLEAYVAAAPARVQAEIEAVFTKSLDASDKLELTGVSAALLGGGVGEEPLSKQSGQSRGLSVD